MPYTVQIESLDRDGTTRHPIVREAASEDEMCMIMLAVIEDVRQALQPVVISAFNPAGGLIATCSGDYRVWTDNLPDMSMLTRSTKP